LVNEEYVRAFFLISRLLLRLAVATPISPDRGRKERRAAHVSFINRFDIMIGRGENVF
jgi:hypothetical protein